MTRTQQREKQNRQQLEAELEKKRREQEQRMKQMGQITSAKKEVSCHGYGPGGEGRPGSGYGDHRDGVTMYKLCMYRKPEPGQCLKYNGGPSNPPPPPVSLP